LDWLDLMLRTMLAKLHDNYPQVIGWLAWPRPAGLGFLSFLLNFGYVVPAFKYSPKLVEFVNVSKICRITVLKV